MFRQSLQLPEPIANITMDHDDMNSIYPSTMSVNSRKLATQTLIDRQHDFDTMSQYTNSKSVTSTVKTKQTRAEMMEQALQLREYERGPTPLEYNNRSNDDDFDVIDEDDDDDRKLPAKPRNDHDDHDTVGDSTLKTTMTNVTSIRELARQQRKAMKLAQAALAQALASLPVPQYEYDLSIPEEKMINGNDEDNIDRMDVDVIDQADLEEKERETRRLLVLKEYEARSSAVKRPELPRPSLDVCTRIKASEIQLPCTTATNMECSLSIAKEVQTLLVHDANNFPILDNNKANLSNKKKKKRKGMDDMVTSNTPEQMEIAEYETIPEDALSAAKRMLDDEYKALIQDRIDTVIRDGHATNNDDAFAFLVSTNIQARHINSDNDNNLEALKAEYEMLYDVTSKMKKRNDKVATKLQITNGGYIKRCDELCNTIQQLHTQIRDTQIEKVVYTKLQSNEIVGSQHRIQYLQKQIRTLHDIEKQLQKRYGDLVLQQRRKQVLDTTR
jgi:hypothetical protein